MKLAARATRIEPFRAMAFAERAARLEATGADVVRLSLGEPDFPVPDPVREALAAELSRGRSTYAPALGLPALREAIADWQRHALGADVSAERVIVTAGASAALLLLAAALVETGDEVLMADPSYPCNRQFVELFGARARTVPSHASERFQFSQRALDAGWSDATRGVMIASPSNPTGTSLPFDELAALCDAIAARGAWRLIDEIYLPLSYDSTPRSILSHDDGALIVGSFSKYWAMPGWRLGWAIVPHDMVGPLERLAQHCYICAPASAQAAALACFHPDTLSECERRRKTLAARRTRTLDGLKQAGFSVPVAPDGAFYAYVDVRATGLDSATLAERLLDEAHVALTPGDDFGRSGGRDFLRLSYAASDERLDMALDRLRGWRATLGR